MADGFAPDADATNLLLVLEAEHTVSTIWTIGAVHLLTQLTDARLKINTSVCLSTVMLVVNGPCVTPSAVCSLYVRDRMKRSLRTELHRARVPLFIARFSGHSDAQPWASECPDVKNYKWWLNLVWHIMCAVYGCTIWQQWRQRVDIRRSTNGLTEHWPLVHRTGLSAIADSWAFLFCVVWNCVIAT